MQSVWLQFYTKSQVWRATDSENASDAFVSQWSFDDAHCQNHWCFPTSIVNWVREFGKKFALPEGSGEVIELKLTRCGTMFSQEKSPLYLANY
jgi:hypothetical protein